MALSATLDSSTYAQGAVVTLTVTRDSEVIAPVITDTTGQTATVSAFIPKDISVTEAARTWSKVSDDGHAAVFTAIA